MAQQVQSTKRSRGVILSDYGWERLQMAEQQAHANPSPLTLKQLSERTGLSLNTLTKVRNRKTPVDRQTVAAYFQAFNLELTPDDCLQPTQNDSLGSLAPRPSAQIDWGEAPDVSVFYGRQQELTSLAEWIGPNQCRLIALLGMGGIGKTALAAKLVQQLVEADSDCRPFEYVIWRSLRNAPPLEVLLAELIPFLSDQADTQTNLRRLVHWLRTHRCLILLDNLETILDQEFVGQFRTGYEQYSELLRTVAESAHQSCVILTSREKPAEVAACEGNAVRTLQLAGSPEAAEEIMQTKRLIGSLEQKQQLSERYGYSPLAVKIVSTSIQELFDGDIDAFLQQDTLVFNGIRRVLDQQFGRLSELETFIMYWLAINREWTSVAELQADIIPVISKPRLLEALEHLNGRSLIEKQAGTYTQQPVVMEYFIDRLIEKVMAELFNQEFRLLLTHAWMKTTVKDYIRESQRRLIVKPIAEQLTHAFGSTDALDCHLKKSIETLRQLNFHTSGYGAGNLLNLCCCLGLDLTGYDFSNLTIWHADLQGVNLHQVNFAAANFAKTVFTRSFTDILSVAFSSDGRFLASADSNGKVSIWDTTTFQLLAKLSGHTSCVLSVAWKPGTTILASGSDDGTIRIWDIQTEQCLRILEGNSGCVFSVAWHPQKSILASGCSNGYIHLWDSDTGQVLLQPAGHSRTVRAVAWSVDGLLASGSDDHTVRIWDSHTGACLKTLQGHQDRVQAVAWSPDGLLASGSDDHTIRIWDRELLECKTLSGHSDTVQALAWNADGTRLASGSSDQTVRIWQIDASQCIRVLPGHTNQVFSVAWCAAKPLLASSDVNQALKLWNSETGDCLASLQGYINFVMAIACHPEPFILASSSADGTVRVWRTDLRQVTLELKAHNTWATALDWSPDGKQLASGSHDKTIKIWELETGQGLRVLQGDMDWVWALDWHPEATIIASGSADPVVRLWDVNQGICLKRFVGHTNSVRTVAWSPDGTLLASGSADHTIRIWDTQTGDCLAVLQGHQDTVLSLAWSPDGTILASGSADCTIRLWQLPSLTSRATWQGHRDWVRAVVWSPDGQFLVSGSADQTLRLWDVESGECLQQLFAHDSKVLALQWSLDGTVISSSADAAIKFWQIPTGQCLKTLRVYRPYENMNIAEVQGLTEAQLSTLKSLGAIELQPVPAIDSTAEIEAPTAESNSTELAETASPRPSSSSYPISHPLVSIVPILQMQLLGRFNLTYDDKPVPGFSSERLQSLLAYLVLHRHTPQLRQHLAFLLWPDSSDSQARGNLRKDLHILRQLLPNADTYIQTDAKTMQWRSNAPFTLDVAEFQTAIHTANAAAIAENFTQAQTASIEALSIYSGDLLPHLHDEWLEIEREQLRQERLQVLDKLVQILEHQQDYQTALRHAQHLLKLEPLREASYQRLMRLYDLSGDRASALQIYHQCMTTLREELGVDPSPLTQELYSGLLT
ncbi:MAG: NACHT domain-containing protein [Elainella sp. C42_A2020_010]|nr:NACHT domain-containing protein [Elainella sp. C42_A2020_010]